MATKQVVRTKVHKKLKAGSAVSAIPLLLLCAGLGPGLVNRAHVVWLIVIDRVVGLLRLRLRLLVLLRFHLRLCLRFCPRPRLRPRLRLLLHFLILSLPRLRFQF